MRFIVLCILCLSAALAGEELLSEASGRFWNSANILLKIEIMKIS